MVKILNYIIMFLGCMGFIHIGKSVVKIAELCLSMSVCIFFVDGFSVGIAILTSLQWAMGSYCSYQMETKRINHSLNRGS